MRALEPARKARLPILNAPFEKDGWAKAVGAICEATGCHGAHLLGMGGPLVTPLNIVRGLDSRIHDYLGDPHLHGPVNWRVGSAWLPMTIQHELHYAAYRSENDTADYDDAASDLDMPFGCQSVLLGDRSMFLGIAMMRSRREGPCTLETLENFAALIRPLQRAIRVQLALDGEAAELMLGDMDSLHGATILLDRLGSVAAMTPAAEAAFEENGPLALAGLAVRLRDPKLDRCLQRGLAHLLKFSDAASAPLHEMRIPSSAGMWQLVAMRLPEREHGLGFHAHLAVTLRSI
jgi:hypothetical protein